MNTLTQSELSDVLTGQGRFNDIINNNPYYFNIRLLSSDNRLQQLKIGSINSLVLDDDFNDFYTKGYIVINNVFDAVERLVDINNLEDASTSTNNNFNSNKGFIFKGDSRDLLLIDILPKLNQDETTTTINNTKNNAFLLSYVFVIYDTEEITGDQPYQKYKKLYFHDWTYQMLCEKNSYFSTSNYLEDNKNDNIIQLDNDQRGIKTGAALKYFLSEFFNSETRQIKFSDDFDEGSRSIFFSAPARFKGIDVMNYILNRHISDENNKYDMSFLRKQRYDQTFAFTSLKKIFENSIKQSTERNTTTTVGNQLYLETFKLGMYSNVDKQYLIEPGSFTPKVALFLDKYGTINNFVYDPMPGMYSQKEIVSTNVHSYDENEKLFAIDVENNDINFIEKVYYENYVKPFNTVSKAGNAYSNFLPGKNREEQKNLKNVFSLIEDKDQRISDGRNNVLYHQIFLNNTVSFKVEGSTHRQAGTFIGIDRDGSLVYSDYHAKILGVYFVIEVKHLFKGNAYFNELRCVKTYSFDNPFINKNSI